MLDWTRLRSCWPLSPSTASWHCGTRNFAPNEQWERCKNGPLHSILSFSLHFFGTEAIKSMPAVYFQQLGLGNRYSNRDRAISWVFVCFNGTVRLQEAQLGGPPVGLISAIFVTTMSCSALHTCHLRKCILSRSCSEVTISGQLI